MQKGTIAANAGHAPIVIAQTRLQQYNCNQ